jgi:hypothetical protein
VVPGSGLFAAAAAACSMTELGIPESSAASSFAEGAMISGGEEIAGKSCEEGRGKGRREGY